MMEDRSGGFGFGGRSRGIAVDALDGGRSVEGVGLNFPCQFRFLKILDQLVKVDLVDSLSS